MWESPARCGRLARSVVVVVVVWLYKLVSNVRKFLTATGELADQEVSTSTVHARKRRLPASSRSTAGYSTSFTVCTSLYAICCICKLCIWNACAYFESMTSCQKSDSVNRPYLLEEQSCQISPRSNLKVRSLVFIERSPNQNKNSKMTIAIWG